MIEDWKDNSGYHIADIEDEEEQLAAYLEFIKTKRPKKMKNKKLGLSVQDEMMEKLRNQNPIFNKIASEIDEPRVPDSLVKG